MARFRKRPIVVEATQWLPADPNGGHPAVMNHGDGRYSVHGKQGFVEVHPGDWIIAEVDGWGHYPCANDIFQETYEPVET